jgi:hypothetical protein
MSLAPAQSSQANELPSRDGLGHHVAPAHTHQALGQQAAAKSLARSEAHVHGGTHDHSVPHTHGPRPSGVRVEVSPVLVGVGARVLTVLALLALLWLAIFWAFAGNA